MRKKKNNKKLENAKRIAYASIAISIIVILALLALLVKDLFAKDYYKVDSRIDNVKNAKEIKNSNFKTIGWLKVQGTDIDVPIVYNNDLNEDFPVELEDFVWSENIDEKFHDVIRINGHNIFNLSAKPKIKDKDFHRFEELMAFVYYDFAKENKYIQLTIDGKDYVYKIFFAGFVEEDNLEFLMKHDDFTKKQMKEYLKFFKDKNLYNYGIDVNETDKLISLSTCTRIFGADKNTDFYVLGRLLREDERINNYRVTKSDNYKKVEKVLKGDDDDEDTL